MARTIYEIRYFDTLDEGAATVVHDAQRGSVILSYNGSDEKIQDIIGSKLSLVVFDKEALDGKFKDFYTADETRWRVEIWYVDEVEPARTRLFWQGFIMPEQYEEPYKAGNIPISVTASDGLGRLKGKYLEDAYYENEYTVMQYITACLAKTGNTFDTYFSPAIANYYKPHWHEIYISGSQFVKDGDVLDCYDVLQLLLQELLCVVYQEWGVWFVVGVNKMAVPELTYFKYSTAGVLIGEVVANRTPYDVRLRSSKSPTIGVVAPYKSIAVSSPIKEIELSRELSEKTRDGWVLPAPLDTVNVGEQLLFREWLVRGYDSDPGNSFWTPNVGVIDGVLNLGVPNSDLIYTNRYVRLARKIFVTEGQRFKFNIAFDYEETEGKNTRLRYEIRVDDLDGNLQVMSMEVRFDKNRIPQGKEYEDYLTAEFIVRHNGYLDVRLYKPTIDEETQEALRLTSIELQQVGYEDTDVFISEINSDYSTEITIPLAFGDDISGCGWRLDKLDDRTAHLFFKNLDIKSVFAFNAAQYVVLDLRELFFVKDLPEFIEVQQGGAGSFITVPVQEVVYNFFNGEQMVFSYDAQALGFIIDTADVLRCVVKDYNYPVGNRSQWGMWVDTVYNVQPRRYSEIVSQVYRNLYQEPHNTLDIDLQGIYGMSALIGFKYIEDKVFYPLNVALNIGAGTTSGVYSEAFYGAPTSGNIAPTVFAGEDQEITDVQSTASLTATESDPDGTIVSRLWEVVTGSATINSPTALETTLSNVVGDEIVLRITVTDNDGATASDEITLSRKLDYTINNAVLIDVSQSSNNSEEVRRKERLQFAPVIPAGSILTLEHTVTLEAVNNDEDSVTEILFECYKNGQLIARFIDPTNFSYSLSYVSGDIITYEVASESVSATGEGATGGATSGLSKVIINTVTFQNGIGEITNDPYTIEASSLASS